MKRDTRSEKAIVTLLDCAHIVSSRRPITFLTLKGTMFEAEAFSLRWLFALGTYGVGDIVTPIALTIAGTFVTVFNVRLMIG